MTNPKQQYAHFMSPETLVAQQRLVAGYYQSLIMMYGMDIEYFRRDYSFFDPDGLLNEDGNVNWTYGYDNNHSFGNVVSSRGYIEMGNDAFIFSMIGADSEQDGKIFFTKEQFKLDFLDAVGKITTEPFETTFEVEVFGGAGEYNHTENYDPFSITFADDVLIATTGAIDDPITLTVSDIQSNINNDICGTKSYVYNWIVQGDMSGTISGTLDENGDGTLTVVATGDLTYNRSLTAEESNGWDIAPQSGDFFRLSFGDGTTEDFAVTSITDRDLNNDGISPFLGKMVWKCNFTRRDASHETVPSGYLESETFENDYLNQIIDIADNISDAVHDYDEDDNTDDDVYGGY